ncbi:MAG: hypothetical protein HGA35_01040, partial [Erysipelotrichaceae bacterium]|nr:hypothetical protein [Erysipelotrichaceae bacterium]
MPWIEPVIDRTQTDVNNLKQLADQINTVGWDSVSSDLRVKWLLGDTGRLYASDFGLLTVDGDTLRISTGRIKGAVNRVDLNRIQGNIRFLRDLLFTEHGIVVVIDDSNPTWGRDDLPFISYINRIRDNVNALVNASFKLVTTPTIQYTNPVDYSAMNDIEQNLYDLKSILDAM